jgi:uncharacterized protein YcnI
MHLKRCIIALAAVAVACAQPAAAHVQIFPDVNNKQIPSCAFAKFVVRVPVERPVPTVRVDVAVPKGVILYAVEPKPGWKYSFTMTRGSISKVSWSGGRLLPHEFDEFAFLAATPKTPGSVNWDAWQYYDDGKIVSWTGGPDADTPHSITTVTQGVCRSKH